MPAKDTSRFFADFMRGVLESERERHRQSMKWLRKKLREQRTNGFISEKLETGTYFLVSGNYHYVKQGVPVSEARLWGHDKPRREDHLGYPLPSKMLVYREMSRLGYKWNDIKREWEQKNLNRRQRYEIVKGEQNVW